MTAVITFGRFQPPTRAHEVIFGNVLNKAKEHSGVPFIFTSATNDGKNNPLCSERKLELLRIMCPEHQIMVMKGPFDALKWISSNGYRKVYFFTGEDRIPKFQDFFRYIDQSLPEEKRLDLDFLSLISTGERTEDGVSSSKVRYFAAAGEFEKFKSLMPIVFAEEIVKEIYMDVRKGLCVYGNI